MLQLMVLNLHIAGWMRCLVRDLWSSSNRIVFTFGVRERWSIRFLNFTLRVHLLDNSILLGLTLLRPPALTLHYSHLWLLLLSLGPYPFDLILHLQETPLSLLPPEPLLLGLALPLPHQRRHLELVEVLDHLQRLRVLPRPLRLYDLLKHVVQ
jgi:hypothetical protein